MEAWSITVWADHLRLLVIAPSLQRAGQLMANLICRHGNPDADTAMYRLLPEFAMMDDIRVEGEGYVLDSYNDVDFYFVVEGRTSDPEPAPEHVNAFFLSGPDVVLGMIAQVVDAKIRWLRFQPAVVQVPA